MRLKQIFAACMILCAISATVFGCNKKTTDPIPTQAVTPQPHSTSDTVDKAPITEFGSTPGASVTDTVAYTFVSDDMVSHYFAFEYKNTGDCPINVTAVDITYTVDGVSRENVFDNPISGGCVIYPGEVSYIAVWAREETTPQATADNNTQPAIAVTEAELAYETTDSERYVFGAENVHLVHNYAAFATVSGDLITNGNRYTIANVICAFKNAEGKLLGVWYFAAHDNQTFFSSQLTALPIDGLAENTADTIVAAYVVS